MPTLIPFAAIYDPQFIWKYLPFTKGPFTLSLVLGILLLLTFTNLAQTSC